MLCATQSYNTVMPYNFTHALVGLTALKQSSDSVSALISQYQGEFLIGTMGPDPFFGDEMPKPLFSRCRKEHADRLHSMDARTLFTALFPLAGKSAATRAYTLGFLCHFLLDTNAHPYIEARFSGAAHTPSEIQMDLMMTDRIGCAGIPRSPRLLYRTSYLSELDELHTALAQTLFPSDSGDFSGAFSRSYRKWIAVNTISYDPGNRKLRFFGWLETIFHHPGNLTGFLVSRHPDPQDRLNLAHAEWRAPWADAISRNESFIDLFDRACAEAPAVMKAALDAMENGCDQEALEKIGARRMDARPV